MTPRPRLLRYPQAVRPPLMPPPPVEGELLLPGPAPLVGAGDPLDPHRLDRADRAWGVSWVCACGQWEAVATSRGTAERVAAAHAEHVREATGG